MQDLILNFKRLNRTTLFILMIMVTGSCRDESIPVPSTGESKLFVAGELNNLDSPIFVVALANDLGAGTGIKYLDAARIVLTNLDSGNEQQLNYNKTSQRYTTSGAVLIPGNKYRLDITSGTAKCSGNVQLPLAFAASSIVTGENTLQITLSQAKEEACYYVADVLQENGNEKISLSFESPGDFSDNYRYNETGFPYNRLFFRLNKKTINFEVVMDNALTSYSGLEIWIRSVPKDYYEYLYNAEVQQESSEKDVDLKGNITGALGIAGAAYKLVIKP